MEEELGRVTHFFAKINVAVLEITQGKLKIGDTIHIKGHTTELYLKVESMESEHVAVEEAGAGTQVGLKVQAPVRPNDRVYRIDEE
ncbi:hypothetical protein ACFLT9_09960 [Acidobacteriota bacterium]